MAHNHNIRDDETHFVIDHLTRTITNSAAGNNILVQYDHNSERFTFDMSRYVDGHDMSEVTEVRIHFRNASPSNLMKTEEMYIPTDLAVSGAKSDKVTFSWLLSNRTTQYVGTLHFSIQFVCVDDDGALEYVWNTGVYKDVTVIETLTSTNAVDVLTANC